MFFRWGSRVHATDTDSWGWYSGQKWPGPENWFGSLDALEAPRGEGLTLDAGASYTEMVWHDADSDGRIEERNLWFTDTTDGDRVVIDGRERVLDEVYSFRDSTLAIKGVPTSVTADVFLFTDKTYMVRLRDTDIPEGASPEWFGDLTLGQYDWRLLTHDAGIRNYDQALMMCFTAGTLIDTPNGPRPVETLREGDMVLTLDNGPQPVRWSGSRAIPGQGAMAPIVFAAGAIGNKTELRLSPQHRVLLEGWRAELMFGTDQVLSAAKHMVNDSTIRQVDCAEVTYVHIMFDTHQLVKSNGAWTESFHPGAQGEAVLSEQWAEITAIFPELATDVAAYGPTARTTLKAWEARALLA